MVSWVVDRTGRFGKRPYYREKDLDRACEVIVRRLLQDKVGRVRFPLTTDELCVLVEQHVSDLDVYADLTDDGFDVEGVTNFSVGVRPEIKVSQTLSASDTRENRYRTTLAHELGHAVFHDEVFQLRFAAGDLFVERGGARVVCKRETMLDAPQVDWMEWQASYASGAFLMPREALTELLRPLVVASGKLTPFRIGTGLSDQLIAAVSDAFAVSREAAKVRLIKLNYLSDKPVTATLFD
ncbi:MAG: ImmA/IrrE family metallo-endopeptidase [Methylobacterium frigidaeris]